jgi:hypothetical protein
LSAGKTIEVRGVGPVLFERSRLARRIIISVKPSGEIRVAVPCRSSFKQAEEFTGNKAAWINRQLSRVKRIKRCPLPAGTAERERARTKLVDRLKSLAERHGFTYNRVSVRDQKARWGSCSGRNNISLSIRLVSLPDELIDYVILHELTHTRKRDHGPAFWAELDKLVGDGRRMSRRLRAYSLR